MTTCYKCGTPIADGTRLCAGCRKAREPQRQEPRTGAPLTFRERQIIRLVVAGETNKEIARKLGLVEGTLKEYVRRLCGKTNSRNRTELAVWGVLHLDDRAGKGALK